MRMWEILLEYREAIDTNEYGAWITDSKEVLDVAQERHAFVAMNNLGIDNKKEAYRTAFDRGWVRIVNESNGIGIEGQLDAIKKNWNIISPTAMRLRKIIIGIVKPNGVEASHDYPFHLPDQKEKLLKFLGKI